MATKKCKYCPTECEIENAGEFFFRRSESPDGFQYHCKTCANRKIRESRARTGPEKKRKREEAKRLAKQRAIELEIQAQKADEESIREFNERAEREGWGNA